MLDAYAGKDHRKEDEVVRFCIFPLVLGEEGVPLASYSCLVASHRCALHFCERRALRPRKSSVGIIVVLSRLLRRSDAAQNKPEAALGEGARCGGGWGISAVPAAAQARAPRQFWEGTITLVPKTAVLATALKAL